MPYPTPHDTAGATILTIDLAGVSATYTVTNIVLGNTNPNAGADATIDVGHLGQTTGDLMATQARPLVVPAADGGSGRTLTFDYIGKTLILDAVTGTYKLTHAAVTLVGGTTASYHTVQSSTLTLQVNDVIRGQASLTLSR